MGAELAGRLRQRLRFEKLRPAPDGSGGRGDSWVPVAEVWGELRPLGHGALSVAAAETRLTSRRWQIVVREGLALDLGMQVRWRGIRLRLTGIAQDPATPDRMTLLAEELGPQG